MNVTIIKWSSFYKLSDLEKIVQKAKNNPYYFEKLFKKTVNQAMAYFYGKTGNYSDAEDLVQEFYIKLFKSIKTYEERGHFNSFFYSVAKSVYIDWLKKKSASGQEVQLDPVLAERGSSDIRRAEIRADIFSALEKLNDLDREILILYFFNELKNEEIAEILKISVENVKVRKHRALKKLKDILGE